MSVRAAVGGRGGGGGGKGAAKRARNCASCGTRNQANARFCQHCGQAFSGEGTGWANAQTLTVLGAAALSLAALFLLFSSVIGDGEDAGRTAATTARTPPAVAEGEGPPDLSTMSPREAADRLFNRVMAADERGDADEVAQFAPMALAAYERLESLDLDAIYHLGLIRTAEGNAEDAGAAVARLRSAAPQHLLASILEHRLALEAGDTAKAERALERFRTDYDDEIGIDRREYRDHGAQIDLFRQRNGLAEGADDAFRVDQDQTAGRQGEETDRPGDHRAHQPDFSRVAGIHADPPGRPIDGLAKHWHTQNRDREHCADQQIDRKEGQQPDRLSSDKFFDVQFISLGAISPVTRQVGRNPTD